MEKGLSTSGVSMPNSMHYPGSPNSKTHSLEEKMDEMRVIWQTVNDKIQTSNIRIAAMTEETKNQNLLLEDEIVQLQTKLDRLQSIFGPT